MMAVQRPLDLIVRVALDLNAQDLLGLAWLCEMAAGGCSSKGNPEWALQLRSEASAIRDLAVNQ